MTLLKRLKKLCEETGNPLILYNEDDSTAHVLMPLEQYENLLHNSHQQPQEFLHSLAASPDVTEAEAVMKGGIEESELEEGQRYYFEPVEESEDELAHDPNTDSPQK